MTLKEREAAAKIVDTCAAECASYRTDNSDETSLTRQLVREVVRAAEAIRRLPITDGTGGSNV